MTMIFIIGSWHNIGSNFMESLPHRIQQTNPRSRLRRTILNIRRWHRSSGHHERVKWHEIPWVLHKGGPSTISQCSHDGTPIERGRSSRRIFTPTWYNRYDLYIYVTSRPRSIQKPRGIWSRTFPTGKHERQTSIRIYSIFGGATQLHRAEICNFRGENHSVVDIPEVYCTNVWSTRRLDNFVWTNSTTEKWCTCKTNIQNVINLECRQLTIKIGYSSFQNILFVP